MVVVVVDGPGKGKENESGEGMKMKRSEGSFWGKAKEGGKREGGGGRILDRHLSLSPLN